MFNLNKHSQGLQNYFVVTLAYWGFTLTDGAIRMLVVLYFNQLGYSPLEIAILFLFYELSGVLTNFIGGWMASRMGLNTTLHLGMGLQVIALLMLAVPVSWLSVPYVMLAQAVSGIAKDLNKMSAKSSVKLMLPENADSKLFRWVAYLTGSKNSIKGLGFFIGGVLLNVFSFQTALIVLAFGLIIILITALVLLPRDMGKTKVKIKFKHLFSKERSINQLSAARFFLFGARDIWFVVALPVYLSMTLGWSHLAVGTFFALWVIGYGVIQASTPSLIRKSHHHQGPDGASATFWALMLLVVLIIMTLIFSSGFNPERVIVSGLVIFGGVFAVNSAIHSYLILAYSSHEQVSVDVGFYYMANALGRLVGTVLSGWMFQRWGLEGCLWAATVFVLASMLISVGLPKNQVLSEK